MAEESTSVGILASIAYNFGASEPALRLLLSILSGYPLAFLYRNVAFNQTATVQHLFFAFFGIVLCYFNYGTDVIHSLGCVLVLYILLMVEGGSPFSVVFAFVYFMGYLLLGYYFTETDTYDITWTTPQCVLTLRAIGLVFDVYDGKKSPEKLSKDQKETALTKVPSLLEIAGYVFFFGGCLVGPQFSMKRYLKFVNKELIPFSKKPDSVGSGLLRGAIGLVYLTFFMVGSSFVPEDYIYSDLFKSKGLFSKYILMGIWGKLVCSKYIISWILSEGSCIITGITYNGKDSSGKELWDGCHNVQLRKYESATKFHHLIEGFNMLTNKWAAAYVYKRLKFMGNKFISQGVTLAFLAIWHGFHVSYYFTFFLEFCVMKLEQDVTAIVSRKPALSSFLNRSPVKEIKWVLQRLYLFVFFSYCLLAFNIISWEKSNQVYAELYYLGHFLYLGWLIGYPVFKKLTRSSKTRVSSENGVGDQKTK